MLREYANEIGIEIIEAGFFVYVRELDKYMEANKVPEGMEAMKFLAHSCALVWLMVVSCPNGLPTQKLPKSYDEPTSHATNKALLYSSLDFLVPVSRLLPTPDGENDGAGWSFGNIA